jgi:hypothetical protein
MSWATHYINKLKEGSRVSFRPRGTSMEPKIKSGQLCTVEPVLDVSNLKVNDVVLCKVKGNQYLHLITAIDTKGRFQISNNKGFVNGWINKNSIYGKLISVEN